MGVGSNLGDRGRNVRFAIGAMRREVKLSAASSIYETEPMYVTDQPRFLNCVVAGSTELVPRELLGRLKEIEAAMGRTPGPRFGPRVIDLDILFYGDRRVVEAGLEIPHPRIPERAFVLVPLAEIRPNLVHPVLRLPVSELRRRLGSTADRDVKRVDALVGLSSSK